MNRSLLPLVHLPLFLAGSIVWVVLIGVAAAVLLLSRGLDPALAEQALSPMTLGVLTVVQIVGMAVWAALLSLAVTTEPPLVPQGARAAWERLRAGMAATRPSLVMVATGLVGGLFVWTFPSWAAEELKALFPGHLSTLELVTDGLRDGPLAGRLVMALAVGVSAPIFEELIFRGYVYRVVAVATGPAAAVLASTLLFAAYHLDPVHVVALLPTAAFLGYLRWRSGSIVPSMLAHAVNNGLGVVGAFFFADDPTETLPLWMAVGGLLVTAAIALLGHRLAPPPAELSAPPPRS